MAINGRNKGANAERDAAKWLQKHFKLVNTPLRNLEQYRNGGVDLIGFPPFAFEIKRQEKLDLRGAWLQIVGACGDDVPVVMYRKNYKDWHFLVSAKWMGLRNGFIRLEQREFLMWGEQRLQEQSE